MNRTLAILGYHKVGPPPPGGWASWYYVPEETFASHLAWLDTHRWEAIDVAALLRGLEEPASLPARAVLITFDDGYRSNLSVAAPVLRRAACPAVIFMPTGFVGGHNDFDRDVEPAEAICDWADLRELERLGVSVQSHGVTHRAFSQLDEASLREELRASKADLERNLGKVVDLISFPYGDDGRDPGVTRGFLQACGYRAACLYGGGPNVLPGADPFRLTRLAMGPDTDLAVEMGAATAVR